MAVLTPPVSGDGPPPGARVAGCGRWTCVLLVPPLGGGVDGLAAAGAGGLQVVWRSGCWCSGGWCRRSGNSQGSLRPRGPGVPCCPAGPLRSTTPCAPVEPGGPCKPVTPGGPDGPGRASRAGRARRTGHLHSNRGSILAQVEVVEAGIEHLCIVLRSHRIVHIDMFAQFRPLHYWSWPLIAITEPLSSWWSSDRGIYHFAHVLFCWLVCFKMVSDWIKTLPVASTPTSMFAASLS